MATFTLTEEQAQRPNSWTLGQLLGQKSDGSADDFSITTTADRDGDGNFLHTYTLEIPVSLTGRATRAEVQAVLDDPRPEQPPPPAPTTRDTAQAKMDDDTATVADIREVLKTR